jgi:hypothetical protein
MLNTLGPRPDIVHAVTDKSVTLSVVSEVKFTPRVAVTKPGGAIDTLKPADLRPVSEYAPDASVCVVRPAFGPSRIVMLALEAPVPVVANEMVPFNVNVDGVCVVGAVTVEDGDPDGDELPHATPRPMTPAASSLVNERSMCWNVRQYTNCGSHVEP